MFFNDFDPPKVVGKTFAEAARGLPAKVALDPTDEERVAFAAGMLRFPNDPMKVALEVFGRQRGDAIYQAAADLPLDPTVIGLKAALLEEHGEEFFLPTKAQIARQIYDRASGPYVSDGDAFHGYKLYAELMGHIVKPGIVNNVNTTTQTNVMVVKDHGTDDDWEAKAKSQQAKLIDVASG